MVDHTRLDLAEIGLLSDLIVAESQRLNQDDPGNTTSMNFYAILNAKLHIMHEDIRASLPPVTPEQWKQTFAEMDALGL